MSKEYYLFEIEIWNFKLTNVLTVTFDQFNASLQTKGINVYWPQTFE